MNATLLLLLVVTNVAWAVWAVMWAPAAPAPQAARGGAAEVVTRRDAEIADLRARLADAEARVAAAGRRASPQPSPVGEPRPVVGPTQTPTPAPGSASSPRTPPIDMSAANRRSEEWRTAIRQIGDEAARDAAWRSVRDAAAGDDRSGVLASLRTISSTIDVNLDRSGIRELILPQLDAPEPPVRIVAWNVLLKLGLEPSDFTKLRDQVLDGPAETRANLLLVLNQARNSVIAGEDAEMVRKLFDVPGAGGDAVFGLQGARLPEEVVTKVLEFARSGRDAASTATDFVLFALPDKPRAVIDFLVERATLGDVSPVDGFPRTVLPDDVGYAADKLRALYAARTNGAVRLHLLELLAKMRDPASSEWLGRVRDDPAEDATVRDAARRALEKPQRR